MQIETTKVRKLGNIFYGWWIVAAGIVLCLFGYGAWFYSFGALFTPISSEFGWSRATTSLAFSLSRLEGGLEGMITGPLVDRFGPRLVVRAGWTMAALGFFLMYYINSYWMFIVSFSLLLSLGMGAGLYTPLQTSVTKWFNEKRGLALGILTTGAAVGGSILVPVTAWLITDYGWRKTVVILGIAAAVLGWGLSFILKPHGPEHYGLLVDGKKVKLASEPASPTPDQTKGETTVATTALSLRQALKTQAFWLMVVAFTFGNTALAAIVVHQIPFIEDMGISKIVAASALGTLTVMSSPGRLFGGWLADRLSVKGLYIISSIVQAIGLIIFSRATSMAWVWAFVAIFGLSFGVRIPVEPAMRAQYFGSKAFGSIMGYMNAFSVLGSFGGPFLAGWIFDITGSYAGAFLILAGMMVAAAISVAFIRPPLMTATTKPLRKL